MGPWGEEAKRYPEKEKVTSISIDAKSHQFHCPTKFQNPKTFYKIKNLLFFKLKSQPFLNKRWLYQKKNHLHRAAVAAITSPDRRQDLIISLNLFSVAPLFFRSFLVTFALLLPTTSFSPRYTIF